LRAEENVIGQHAQDAARGNEGFDQRFKIGRRGGILGPDQVFPPVEERLAGKRPGSAVEELHQVGEGEELRLHQQVGRFAVIAAHLIEGLGDALQPGGGFGLHQDDGDAVDQEDHIGADFVRAALEAEFIGDVEGVSLDLLRVKQTQVALAALRLDEDGLQPFEIFPGLAIALDVGAEAHQASDDLGSLFRRGHNAGVQTLQLRDQHILQERLLRTVTQA
jgi:hypothetical protein